MRTERASAALLLALALAGCATPVERDVRSTASGSTQGCDPTTELQAGDCALPPDVRAFLADRALCDHFRGEPWPESDSDADRARRRELVDGVRTNCAGTDRQLAALRERHRDDARVVARLAGFEERIED